jgi:hypothetical protein
MAIGVAGRRTPAQAKQNKIITALRNLGDLPKTSVTIEASGDIVNIQHEQMFVPNFRLE